MLKIGIIQQSNTSELNLNREKLRRSIELCARSGAQLIVLQELHDHQYFCQCEDTENFQFAELIPGETTRFYSNIAKQNQIVLVTSLFEKRTSGIYHNTAVVFEKDGSMAGKYRKMHIPDDPNFYEKFYFTPGDIGFQPIKTSIGTLGVLICWDQWFPEAARLMTLAGAEILIYPTAIGWTSNDDNDEKNRQLQAWITLQRGHAIANGVHVVAVNRIGLEADQSGKSDGILFWGNSFIAGPQGEIIKQAPANEEINMIADIDLKHSEYVRRWWPFLRDRRIDSYENLLKRFID